MVLRRPGEQSRRALENGKRCKHPTVNVPECFGGLNSADAREMIGGSEKALGKTEDGGKNVLQEMHLRVGGLNRAEER